MLPIPFIDYNIHKRCPNYKGINLAFVLDTLSANPAKVF